MNRFVSCSLTCGLFLACLSLSGAAGCSAEGERTTLLVSPDMVFTIPYDPYDPNPNTDHGGTLLLPPEGTAPVGSKHFPFGPGREETDRASTEFPNPLVASEENLARGKVVFETFCAVCHSKDASGGKKGSWPMTGPSLQAGRPVQLKDGGIFHIVTMGQGTMASYAKQIRAEDRWKAILHLRTLQEGAAK